MTRRRVEHQRAVVEVAAGERGFDRGLTRDEPVEGAVELDLVGRAEPAQARCRRRDRGRWRAWKRGRSAGWRSTRWPARRDTGRPACRAAGRLAQPLRSKNV